MTQRPLNVNSLNKEFLLFRNNAIQRKRFRKDKFPGDDDDDEFGSDDRVSLLRDHEGHNGANGDIERGAAARFSRATPSYVGQTDALVYQLGRLDERIDALEAALKASATRPDAFGTDDQEEDRVASLTGEVTRSLTRCHEGLRALRRATASAAREPLEVMLAGNIVLAMTNRLREVAERFGSLQGVHLKEARAREEKSKLYFDDFLDESSADDFVNALPSDRRLNTQELIQMEENTMYVEKREKEIGQVVKSISDLNVIFKDLAQMVSEQGSIVDRIDHNVENTQIKVQDGLQQLKKAERYQKKNRKMHCIVILAVIVIILLFILIIKVS